MSTEIQKKQDSIITQVLNRVRTLQQAGAIMLPPDYSVENALKAAELTLQEMEKDDKPVLEYCTKPSIASALLKMITQGLTVLKNQGAFVVYGNKLSWQREYFGTVAMAKRYSGISTPRANVVYEGDVIKFSIDPETGIKKLVSHDQDPENIDINKIKGAYAILQEIDGTTVFEYMTMTQIRQAWLQGAAKGNSPAHRNFTDQMAMKTVISRICKPYINESDDSVLYGSSIENTTFTDITDDEPADEIQSIEPPKPAQDLVSPAKPMPENKEKTKEIPF